MIPHQFGGKSNLICLERVKDTVVKRLQFLWVLGWRRYYCYSIIFGVKSLNIDVKHGCPRTTKLHVLSEGLTCLMKCHRKFTKSTSVIHPYLLAETAEPSITKKAKFEMHLNKTKWNICKPIMKNLFGCKLTVAYFGVGNMEECISLLEICFQRHCNQCFTFGRCNCSNLFLIFLQ
jgi:hypothetical protein